MSSAQPFRACTSRNAPAAGYPAREESVRLQRVILLLNVAAPEGLDCTPVASGSAAAFKTSSTQDYLVATGSGFAAHLDRRTGARSVGAEHAAVSGLRPQQRVTGCALVKVLAGVGRHGLELSDATRRAGHDRFEHQRRFRHRHTPPLTTSPRSPITSPEREQSDPEFGTPCARLTHFGTPAPPQHGRERNGGLPSHLQTLSESRICDRIRENR